MSSGLCEEKKRTPGALCRGRGRTEAPALPGVDLGAESAGGAYFHPSCHAASQRSAPLVLRVPREDEAAAVVEIGGVEVLVGAVHDRQRERPAPLPVDEPRDEEVVKARQHGRARASMRPRARP